jgi:hypothetical protein
MPAAAVQEVFRAVTLAKLTYCSPAWWGFSRADDRDRLEGFLRRCKRYGYCSETCSSFNDICANADNMLFKRILSNSNHMLHNLLPPKNTVVYNLRPRRHDRFLPECTDRFDACNFVSRMLSNNRCK